MAGPDIRQVDPEEWRALRALRLDALRDSPDAFGSTLEHESHADEDVWRGWTTGDGWGGPVVTFVADDAGTLVGMATGFHPDDEPAHVWLFAMWVRTDRRNERIGRELVASIARWATERAGVDQVLLRVTVSNEAAVRFYASCGFVGTPDPPEPLREGSDLTTQTMRLLLGERADEELVRSQIDYYDDRAPVYEDWWFRRASHDRGAWVNDRWFAETAIAEADLASIDATGDVLELACGSGIWTRSLAPRARSVIAVDASPRMLELNRRRVADPKVEYQFADIFEWDTEQRFDLIVAGFFVSHVPPSLFATFWAKLARWLRADGVVWLVDDATPLAVPPASAQSVGGQLHAHRRRLDDRDYTIVKLFYSPKELTACLDEIGWNADLRGTGEHLLIGTVRPR